jgi:hypothetical protein
VKSGHRMFLSGRRPSTTVVRRQPDESNKAHRPR